MPVRQTSAHSTIKVLEVWALHLQHQHYRPITNANPSKKTNKQMELLGVEPR